ncbi:MAG TPA: 2-oxoacid:ferredoxin oxidoreductase subunit beta [Dehalococcoidia bacterium]|nr:2-oxoacid:ferredoxin oxidoreductase subunit beta [Dehalococcoidia bacterium]
MVAEALTLQDYKTPEESWWCPGCGDFGVLAALQKALLDLQLKPENVAIVAGIGCSGKIGNYINSYNIHVTHGRTMPAALGLKLANRELTVIAAGGDGDGYAIGMGHFMHALRRNADITYIVMDNQIYGLTKGQTSPTSAMGFETKSTPSGNKEHNVRPLQLAVAGGATYVAQGFSSNQRQLVELIKGAVRHKGFSLVNTQSPCVTFNKLNTYAWWKQKLVDITTVEGYDPHDRVAAMKLLAEQDEAVTGLVYEDTVSESFDQMLPGFREQGIVNQEWTVPQSEFQKILAGYR